MVLNRHFKLPLLVAIHKKSTQVCLVKTNNAGARTILTSNFRRFSISSPFLFVVYGKILDLWWFDSGELSVVLFDSIESNEGKIMSSVAHIFYKERHYHNTRYILKSKISIIFSFIHSFISLFCDCGYEAKYRLFCLW